MSMSMIIRHLKLSKLVQLLPRSDIAPTCASDIKVWSTLGSFDSDLNRFAVRKMLKASVMSKLPLDRRNSQDLNLLFSTAPGHPASDTIAASFAGQDCPKSDS